jgi:hypothetical protein
MKNIIKCGSLIFAMSLSANAVSILMDEGTTRGHKAVTAEGVRLDNGSLIRWGTMSGAASSENFVQFATTSIGALATTGANASIFGFITRDINTAGVLPIGGSQIYMWLYNASTAGTATQQALFTSVGWVAPSNFSTDALASYNLVLGQPVGGLPAAPIITAVPVTGFTTGTRTIGTVQTATLTSPDGNIFTLGAAIPETSTTLLGALGALALLRRRRN